MKKYILLLTVLFVAVLTVFCSDSYAASSEATDSWHAQKGDFLVFDIGKNMGYLLREDMSEGVYFPIASGEQKERYFRGEKYFAGTPVREWTMGSLHYHPTGSTYGRHGKFLRLYDENGATHYGVHTVYNEKEIFSMTDRYGSWGCVLTKENTFALIESVFYANEQKVRVITLEDMSKFPLSQAGLVPLSFID